MDSAYNDIFDEVCDAYAEDLKSSEVEACNSEPEPWGHYIYTPFDVMFVSFMRFLKANPLVRVSEDKRHSHTNVPYGDRCLFFEFNCSLSYRELYCLYGGLHDIYCKVNKYIGTQAVIDGFVFKSDMDWNMTFKVLVGSNLKSYNNMLGIEIQRLEREAIAREIKHCKYIDNCEKQILYDLSFKDKPFDALDFGCLSLEPFRDSRYDGLFDSLQIEDFFYKLYYAKDNAGARANIFAALDIDELRNHKPRSYRINASEKYFAKSITLSDSRIYKLFDNLYIIARANATTDDNSSSWLTISLNYRKKRYNWHAFTKTLNTLFGRRDNITQIYAKLYTEYGHLR